MKKLANLVFILMIFLISLFVLGCDNEEPLVGEAYSRSMSSNSPEPYFQLYTEYKRFSEMGREETISFKDFNSALLRSNVFLIDCREDYREDRAELSNRYSEIKKLVNKVYSDVSEDKISLTAWYIVFEDRFKTEILGEHFDKPINPAFFRELSNLKGLNSLVSEPTGQEGYNSITGRAIAGGSSGTVFSDCAEGNNPKASGSLAGTTVDPMDPKKGATSTVEKKWSDGGPCGNIDPKKVGFSSDVGQSDDEEDDIWGEMEDMENGDDNFGSDDAGSNQNAAFDEMDAMEDSGSMDSGGEMDEPMKEPEGTTFGTLSEDEFEDIKAGAKGSNSKQDSEQTNENDCGGAGSNPANTLMDCSGDEEDDCDDAEINPVGTSDKGYGSTGCGGGGADPAMVEADITQSYISGYNPIDSVTLNKIGLNQFGEELFIKVKN